MKKINAKLISILLILILIATALCSCAKSYDSVESGMSAGNKNTAAGTDLMSPEASNSTSSTVETERKIIKTVNINAETKEFDKTVENINKMTSDIGGYVETSSVSGNSYTSSSRSRVANFTLRIPADKLDEFTGTVETSVNVTNLTSDSKEITDTYYDASARLEVLEAQKKVYEDLLNKATTTNEVLSISDKLYDVIAEIESYKARLNTYDKQVDYSTVNVTIREVVEYTPISSPENFGERLIVSFKNGWVDFWAGCQDFAVWFVGAIPALILIAALMVVAIILLKKIIKKHKATKDPNAPKPCKCNRKSKNKTTVEATQEASKEQKNED